MLRRNGRSAFTMLEVMVTLAIGVLIMGLVWQIMTGSTKINRKVEDKTEAIQSANLALEAIKRDLRQLATRPFIDKGNGVLTGVAGDAQHPVLISPDGTEMSFHVPDTKNPTPDADGRYKLATVYYGIYKAQVEDGGLKADVYHLVRAEGTNPNEVQEASRAAGQAKSAIGAIYLKPGKDAQGNPVPPITFRLLGPNPNIGPGSPQAPSGDSNYYVEIRLFGADGQAKESQPRADLVHLSQPSRLANVPALRVSEFTLFEGNPQAPVFVAKLPPGPVIDSPVNLGQPTDPKPGAPGGPVDPGDPGNPSNPNNPAGPGGPNDPGNPANPNNPGGNPQNPGPSGGTPTGPSGPTNPPTGGGPSAPPGGNPDNDPDGNKAVQTYIKYKDSAGTQIAFRIDAVLRKDGSLYLIKRDASGAVVSSDKVTPAGDGLDAVKTAMNDWGSKNGVDMSKVPVDPNIVPPPEYTNN